MFYLFQRIKVHWHEPPSGGRLGALLAHKRVPERPHRDRMPTSRGTQLPRGTVWVPWDSIQSCGTQ